MMRLKWYLFLIFLKNNIYYLLFFVYLTIFTIWIYILNYKYNEPYNIYIEKKEENIKHLDDLSTKDIELNLKNSITKDNLVNIDSISKTELEDYQNFTKDLLNKIEQKEKELYDQSKINFIYNPQIIETKLYNNAWINAINTLINSNLFKDKKLNFDLILNFQKDAVRWKYKNKTISLYSLVDIKDNELLAVFIHELGHYIDIDFLQKKVLNDLSNNFYDISWEDTYEIKAWLSKTDFVSWYALTNKYEDFAESFLYYVLFNSDFREKSLKSDLIKQKYDFFSNYIFKQDEFKKTNFRIEFDLKDYYWDITKINFSLNNFLHYLKK